MQSGRLALHAWRLPAAARAAPKDLTCSYGRVTTGKAVFIQHARFMRHAETELLTPSRCRVLCVRVHARVCTLDAVFALSFSGPVMYEKNKAIIDNTAMTHKQKIMAMIPRATMTKYDKHDEQRPKED